MSEALQEHEQTVEGLIRALRAAEPSAPGSGVEVIETHISSVILAGTSAYKLKKPVALGFLDFTDPADRRHFCAEELRLNSRLAPSIYRDLVSITGRPEAPRIDAPGEPFDFAVRMHRFPQAALLSRHAEAGDLEPSWFDALAERVARFHREIAPVQEAADPTLGTPPRLAQAMYDNFAHLGSVIVSPARRAQVAALEGWTRAAAAEHAETMAARRTGGFVRECHGDMHLGNMVLIDGAVEVFDGIEFNDDFRWIDTQSEIAFLTMDLDHRGAAPLAWRFLNAYLAASGDYAGTVLHRLYQTYRAMVRAKVDGIRALQEHITKADRERALADCAAHLDLAERYTSPPAPRLLLTCGLSGSGKSTVARRRASSDGLIHLRSDVERKRLHGLSALADSASPLDGGIYSAEATARTYERLRTLASELLDAGHGVVVDATFLTRAQRAPFLALAAERGVAATILYCEADREELGRRIAARAGDASEADLAVLAAQEPRFEPPGPDEPAETIRGA